MKTLRIAIPGLLAALALAGCGDSETKRTVAADLCVEHGVVCENIAGVSCDPTDAVCKCGGKGGVVCGPDMVCDLVSNVDPPSATCVSEKCVGKTCKAFESCDATDGLCKCDGKLCDDGQTCLADGCSDEDPCAGVVCDAGQVCDPSDRICKCGGKICSVGESCRLDDQDVGYCVGRNCVGKNCVEGTVCNQADGMCHCGSADGNICSTGQACEVVAGESVCIGPDICADVVCPSHSVCSPLDGKCHCGGLGAASPVCAANQICDLEQSPPRCVGGNLCEGVTCDASSNLSCDEETGECRCGGTGGVACAPEESCIAASGQPACVIPCIPYRSNVSIEVCGSATQGCYFSPADELAYCAEGGPLPEGSDCWDSLECEANHHCAQTSGSTYAKCRKYCDVSVQGSCYDQHELRYCAPLSNVPFSLANLGVCVKAP